jgi:hypothetical protein
VKYLDACIHTAHFAVDFTGCPLFEAVAFTPTTFAGLPLGSHVACRHLEAAGAHDRGPFYPRCRLGGPEAARLLAALRGTAATA